MSLTSIASNIQISLAGPEHDFEIGELLVRSFVESYAREMPDVTVSESRKKYLREVAPKRINATLLIATFDSNFHAKSEGELGKFGQLTSIKSGTILGTVCLFRPAHDDNRSWIKGAYDLRQLVVLPEVQGLGVAQALMQACETFVKKDSRQTGSIITLHVRRGATGVAKFYTNLGYIRTPDGDRDQLPEIFLEAYVKSIDFFRN